MNCLSLIQMLSAVSDAPSNDAAELIAHFMNKPPEWRILNRNAEVSDEVVAAAHAMLDGKPLQYLIGYAWFYGNRFCVTPDVLIPQPDTEFVVEAALPLLHSDSKLLDLCTGSGCIAISLLKQKNIFAHAVDISAAALAVAQKNAEFHRVADRLTLTLTDVFDEAVVPLFNDADVIVSNPPYIRTDVIPSLPAAVKAEPKLALDGGSDGLIFYRRFISLAVSMKPTAIFICEIGYDQAAATADFCEKAGLSCRFLRDFNNIQRVAVITHSAH